VSDGATFSLDSKKLAADGDRMVRQHLAAGTQAVTTTTRALERKLEAATQAAVPGRLFRAWNSSAYPEKGPAQNPVGTVWLKGRARTQGAVQFWTTPGAIRNKGATGGKYLAVPLPAAGSRGRGRSLSPVEWEARHNQELRFVARRGRPPLLVADNAVLSGRTRIARPNTARRTAAGRASTTVPIFVLLPLVRHRNAFSVAPIVDASKGELAREFFAAVRSAG